RRRRTWTAAHWCRRRHAGGGYPEREDSCAVEENAGVVAALQFAATLEIVQVGNGLAHGEQGLMRVGDVASEQDGQERGRSVRLAPACGNQLGAAFGVVGFECGDAGVDA